jgi:hypothetical protein
VKSKKKMDDDDGEGVEGLIKEDRHRQGSETGRRRGFI